MRRLLAALRILFLPGDHMPVTRRDLLEWEGRMLELEQRMAAQLSNLSMWWARLAKREARELDRQSQLVLQEQSQPPEPTPISPKERKRLLYRKAMGADIDVPPPPDADKTHGASRVEESRETATGPSRATKADAARDGDGGGILQLEEDE